MDMFGSSECSSGCESGWTLYLDHSASSSLNRSIKPENSSFYKDKNLSFQQETQEDEEEEEDLSMVSDASSGPQILQQNESFESKKSKKGSQKQRSKENRGVDKDLNKVSSFLDDTASSPFLNFSTNNNYGMPNNQICSENALDYSQGYSATHLQGRPAFPDHFGYFQPSLPPNPHQTNQWF